MSVEIGADTRIPVLGVSGEHLYWADDEQARELLRAGSARLIRRGGRVRMVQATASYTRTVGLALLGRGTAADHTRYSHDHETPHNPPRVWTFTKLWATA